MKIERLLFFLVFLAGIVTGSNKASAQTNVVPDNIEFAALKAIYDSLGGAAWTTKTNWPAPGAWPASATSAQMATWYGVTVANGDVTSLSYTGNNVVGKIPAAIGTLSALKTLFFNGNNLTGKIPPAIGQLTNLTYLLIGSQPNLGGPIPNLSTLTQLTTFSLRNNPSLTPGPIPAWIPNLTTLTNLDLNGTKRNGAIPSNIGNLINLTNLDLTVNQLTGSLPISIGALIKLTNLNLSSNQLSGAIPSETGNLINLVTLNLNSNRLTGSIPITLGQLNKLVNLYLNVNQLTGSIPSSLGNITTLVNLYLNNNLLSGSIPDQLGNLSNLVVMYLYVNNLSGSIPASLGNLTKLQYLYLYQNQLTGAIPSSLGNLINLTYLHLSTNQLSGSIPSELGNLSKLIVLYLHQNKLSGSIPPSLGNLVNLTQLYLYTNQLSGELPSTLNNLIKLQYFYASGNQFSGALPNFSAWAQIYLFYIDNNKFSGQLPDNFFTTWTKLGLLSIGNNSFTGSFPSSIGSCPLITYLRSDLCNFASLPASILVPSALNSINFDSNELKTIPNFAGKTALTLRLVNNRLDFSQLEPLIGAGIVASFTYAPQKTINDTPTQPITIGSDFILTARPKGAQTSNLKWEKLQPNGVTWLDISSSNANPLTGNTYRIVNATTAAEGKYRWNCTSTKATGMTLMSDAIDTKTPEHFTLDNWSFQYKYDGRKRMIAKKVPGAEWVYMVYDNRDRLVLTQDGEQRKVNKWAFTKYDELNRPIMTGIKDTSLYLTQALMQSAVNAHFAKASAKWGEVYVGNVAGNVHGYSNKSYPVRTGTTTTEVDANKYLTITYYDNYNFRTLWAGTYAYLNENLSATSNSITYTQPVTEFTRVTGQVTGTKIRILENSGALSYTWIKSVNYFDDKYRVIQIISDNSKGGIDLTTNVYDFVGKTLKSKQTQTENDITWAGVVNAIAEGNKLTCTSIAGWNTGAISSQRLPAGQDGWMEVTASDINYKSIGFAKSINSSHVYGGATVDYVLDLATSLLRIYESGVLKYTGVSGDLKQGDVLRIERSGTTIRYKKNGVVVYTSLTPSTTSLTIDAAFNSVGSTLMNVNTSFTASAQTVTRTFTYDHTGRLLKTFHSINGATPVLLAQNEYNELGQLVDKKLHSADNGTTFKQSVDYRYNIRGWLTSINNGQLTVDPTNDDTGDLFGMNLNYNNLVAGLTTAGDEQFNGNISSISYSANQGLGTLKERGYKFGYDAMNRLTGAAHKEKTTAWNAATAYHEDNLSYDLNGNIQSLNRKGENGSTMDVLTYTYGTGNSAGNQLKTVSDGGDITKGFIDGNIASTDYTYDANGNMTVDKNKGITAITYNHLNLPDKVTKSTGDYVKYIYDATGRKLSQQVYNSANSLIKKTDYGGEYIYENDVLQFVNHEEGRITKGSAGKQIVPSPQLVSNSDAATTAGFVSVSTATVTNETQSSETYLKVISTGAVQTPGFYSNYIQVKPGKTYQYKFKGYRTTSAAYLYVIGEVVGNIVWATKLIPSGAGNEAWVTADFTVPANVAQIKVGALWSPVTIGDIIYANKIELYEIDPVNGAFIEVDVASALPTEYQYHLKDHLGNVRTTFTSKDEIEAPKATLETATETTERGQFLNYDNARKIYSHIFDRTNGTAPTATPGYSQRLSGSATEKIGLARSLSVMPGDKLQLEVFAKYFDASNPTNISAFASWINTIALGTATGGTIIDGAGYATNTATNVPFGGLLNKTSETGTAPKAYLNWLVFDRNYNVDLSESGYKRLTTAALENGNDAAFEWIKPDQDIIITQAGYAYIWISNENLTPVEVYFDDFKVTQTKSPVVQSDDYYPFGLTFNSYSRENSVLNKMKLFQDQEHINDLGLNWDSYRYRNHMPDIGRFINIDPMASAFYYNSPYAFSENKVTTHREMEGLEAFFIHGSTADNSMWKKDVANFIMRELKPYFNTQQTADTGFKWNQYSGGGMNRNWIYNTESDRASAARQLVSYILKNRKQGQGITLVGHSHGGNVAMQAARILFEKHNTRVNIVNFNTPAFNGANDPENPWDNFGIDEMLHFFTDADYVAGPASGSSKYGGLVGSNVNQIRLSNPLKTNFIRTAQHGFENVNWQEVLSQFAAMNGNQSSSTGGKKKKKPDADEEACKRSGGCK